MGERRVDGGSSTDVIWNPHSVTQTKGGRPRISKYVGFVIHIMVVLLSLPGTNGYLSVLEKRKNVIPRRHRSKDQKHGDIAYDSEYSIFQSKRENIVDVKRMQLGWERNGKRLGGEVNAELSQPFFRGLILRSFLRAPSPTTDTIPIYNGSNDPNRRRLGPLPSAISVNPLNLLRLLL